MNIFEKVSQKPVDGANFNLKHHNTTSFDIGELIPTLSMEVIPGDTHKIDVDSMFRLAPMVSPVFAKMEIHHDVFFVPNRILWDNWKDFWTRKEDGLEHPHVGNNNLSYVPGTLGHYLGYQVTPENTQNMSAIPAAAYECIYNEYYRAQFIEADIPYELEDGNNVYHRGRLGQVPRKRAWANDYFTSALPFPQAGEAVNLPLLQDGTAIVELDNNQFANQIVVGVNSGVLTNSELFTGPTGNLSADVSDALLDPNGTLIVNLQNEAVSLDTLREAFALQRFFEKEARGGSRYTEQLRSFYGVTPSDASIDRPIYVGRTTQNMVISEVLTTAETIDNPVGNLQGHGISVGKGKKLSYTAEEHGILMVMTSCRPDATYYQGLPKMLWKNDAFDYANPMFANLGEQEILVGELFTDPEEMDAGDFNTTFGYTPRYAELKYLPNRVTGDFAETLDFWHMGRKFIEPPSLTTDFIHCQHDNSIFADISEATDKIYGQIQFNINSYRKLPKYGIPSII